MNFSRYWADMGFALNGTVTLTFDLVTWKLIGVIYWPWPIFLQSAMTVTHKLLKILSGHGFALNSTVTLTFDLGTWKFIGVIYWPWPIFLPSTMTVTHKLFKILSGHDVANGRTDGRTDGRTPYHNTSEVLLRAYKNVLQLPTILFIIVYFPGNKQIIMNEVPSISCSNFTWARI